MRVSEDFKENAIEWVNGDYEATLSLNQRAFITKIRKLAEKHDDVKIIRENPDGSILARIPVHYIKLNAKKELSDEQRQMLRERISQVNARVETPDE